MPIKKDSFTGTCTELATRIQKEGVKDAGGTHKGRPGNTHAEPEVTLKYKKRVDSKRRLYCKVKETYYDTVQECQRFCPTIIGTIPCVPRDNVYKVTLTAKPSFKASPVSTRIHWESGSKNTPACKQDIKRWYADVQKHEAKHMKDVNKIVTKRTSGSKSMTFIGYGDTEAAAEGKARAQAEKYIDDETTAMKNTIEADADAFHNTKAGKTTPNPDCNKC